MRVAGIGGRRRQVVRLGVDVGGEVPGREWLDAFVADATDVEAGVDHLLLFLDRDHMRELVVGEPHRQADVHRAFVGPHADAREQARVRDRAVRVEVVALRPGGVAFDRMGEIVTRVENRHTATLLRDF